MEIINKKPLVSICCLVYNHEPYLRECFDGFLAQKTNFDFEVLIHDDASTDGTVDIIREYESKYPDIIKPIYQTENQYSKGVKVSATFNFPRAKGKYIAMCEGDDYWTDPLKLQKQVDFLESHQDYVMCSHHFITYNQSTKELGNDWNAHIDKDLSFDLNYFIQPSTWITQPLTLLFRKECLDLNKYLLYKDAKDITFIYHLLTSGKGMFLKDNMGIYRIHSGGVWAGVNKNLQNESDFKAKIGIYKIERSYISARYLRGQFAKYISRLWMLSEWKLMMTVFKIISKYYGFLPTIKLYCQKIIFNKTLKNI